MNNDGELGRAAAPVRPSPKRSILTAATLAVLSAGLIACTTDTNGQPSPGVSEPAATRPTLPGAGGTATNPSRPSSTNPDDSPIKDTDPCTLLTPTETSELGVGEAKPLNASSGSRGCEWIASGQFAIHVKSYSTRGIKDVQATGEIKSLPTVGRHQAVQSMYGTACAVSIEITKTSRVDASASADGDNAKSCQIATRLAQVIEPKLPGGS
jgi:hypothetical protein